MHKLKKILIILVCTLIVLVGVVIVFVSPITKYLVEKYDEKYTGREITMDLPYVNPFTGYIYFRNLKIYEHKSDSIFFSTSSLSVNLALFKLFSKTYEISELTLTNPRGIVIQDRKELNFDDLIKKFSSDDSADTSKAPIHFNILSIKINNGEFHYREKVTPINYFIKNVNFKSTGKQWNSDTIAVQFSFTSGTGSGDMEGDFTINLKSNDYRIAVAIHKFDLNIIEQYLNDLSNYGSFSANIDADMKAKGNFNEAENITATGMLAINDFHFGKNPNEDYAAFKKLALGIIELSPKNHKYLFDSVSLSQPYLKYERYDYLDNFQTMFGKNGSNVSAVQHDPDHFNLILEIGNYVKLLAKNFFKSYYNINRLAIYKGDLLFNDYSLSEKFSIKLNPLFVFADSIDKNHKRVSVSFKTGIKPYGNASIALSINPKDSGEFDMQYHFQKISIASFNPYTISYTSYPLDRGTLEFNGSWVVRNGIIKSNNHLVVIDPRVAKRSKNKDTKWIPMPLMMSFIRERGNVIDYQIPISGDLKNPKFHLRDVIFDLLGNIFIKPPTTQYGLEVKSRETEIEKALSLKWKVRNSTLKPNQEKFIEKIADYLSKNPEASIVVYPQQYAQKEKEYILFFEAKKKYFLQIHNKSIESFSEDDLKKVDKMSVKDPLFVSYLNKELNDSMLFTIQDKCGKFLNSTIVDIKFKQLNKEREDAFLSFFKKKDVESRIKIKSGKNVIPYNGFSFYKIEYKGELPKFLIKAYAQMDELNDKAPRKRFKEEHNKTNSTL